MFLDRLLGANQVEGVRRSTGRRPKRGRRAAVACPDKRQSCAFLPTRDRTLATQEAGRRSFSGFALLPGEPRSIAVASRTITGRFDEEVRVGPTRCTGLQPRDQLDVVA